MHSVTELASSSTFEVDGSSPVHFLIMPSPTSPLIRTTSWPRALPTVEGRSHYPLA
jgi:hypothetical protein